MSKNKAFDSWGGFQLSRTFGSAHETDKDRAKREIMEFMPPLRGDNEVIVVDPEAYFLVDEVGPNRPWNRADSCFSSAMKTEETE